MSVKTIKIQDGRYVRVDAEQLKHTDSSKEILNKPNVTQYEQVTDRDRVNIQYVKEGYQTTSMNDWFRRAYLMDRPVSQEQIDVWDSVKQYNERVHGLTDTYIYYEDSQVYNIHYIGEQTGRYRDKAAKLYRNEYTRTGKLRKHKVLTPNVWDDTNNICTGYAYLNRDRDLLSGTMNVLDHFFSTKFNTDLTSKSDVDFTEFERVMSNPTLVDELVEKRANELGISESQLKSVVMDTYNYTGINEYSITRTHILMLLSSLLGLDYSFFNWKE